MLKEGGVRSSTELDKALSVCQSRGDSLTSAVATVSCRPVAHPGGTPLAGARNSDSVRSGLAPEFAFLTSSRETLVSLVPGPHLEDACPRGRRQRPSDGAPGGRAGFRPQGRAGRRVRADGGRCCRRAWGPGRGTRNRALGPGEGGCAADWWVSTARSCSHPAGSDAVAKRPGWLWKAGWGSWHRERRGTAGPAGSAAGLSRGGAAQGEPPPATWGAPAATLPHRAQSQTLCAWAWLPCPLVPPDRGGAGVRRAGTTEQGGD